MSWIRLLPSLPSLMSFEAVYRLGNFRLAAEELSISQSAVSHRIAALEKFLGCKLLVRKSTGVTLTPEGAVFYTTTKQALEALAESAGRIKNSPTRKTLSVAATPAFMTWWLLPRLGAFSRQNPDLELKLSVVDAEPRVGTGDVGFDALISLRPLSRPLSTNDVPLWREKVFPVCAPSLASACVEGELAGVTLIEEDHVDYRELGWSLWLDRLGVVRQRPAKLRFSHFSLALSAALDGLGLALGRSPLVDRLVLSGKLVRPFGPSAEILTDRIFVVSLNEERKNNRKVAKFLDFIDSEAASLRIIAEDVNAEIDISRIDVAQPTRGPRGKYHS